MKDDTSLKDYAKAKLDLAKKKLSEYEFTKDLLTDTEITPLQHRELQDIIEYSELNDVWDRSQIFMYQHNLRQVKLFILDAYGSHPQNIDLACVHYCLSRLALESLQSKGFMESELEYALLIAHFTHLKMRLENEDKLEELKKSKRKNQILQQQLEKGL